ncbi:MAG: GAF domain-containing protein, partial [Anaerolineales bacterium]|nr:GAF domain-containing protein [Anaerolineales bacterium]
MLELVDRFAQEELSARATVTQTAVAANGTANNEKTCQYPIAQTGYWLQVECSTPLNDDETAVLSIVATLLSQSDYFQSLLAGQKAQAKQQAIIRSVIEAAQVLQPIDETVVDMHHRLLQIFNTDTGYIALYNGNNRQITFPVVTEKGQRLIQEPVSSLDDESLSAWVIVNNKAYVTGNWAKDEKPVPGILNQGQMASIMSVPLFVQEEVIGVISLQSDTFNAFSQADFQLLESLAEQIAIIIKNAQLYTTTRTMVTQGVQDYQIAVALRQAIAVIGTSLDVNVILKNLLLALSDLLVYDVAYVFLWQDSQFMFGAGHDYYERPLPLSPSESEQIWQDNAILHLVRQSKEIQTLHNVTDDPRWPDFTGHEKAQTWIGIPLVINGQVLGILSVISHNDDAFTKHEQWLASTIATHSAVALQNAYLHQQTEQQLRELGTLYQASATMTANLDQDFVLQTVATEMVRAIQVDSCSIFVWDQTHRNLYPAAHENQASAMQWEREQSHIGLRNIEHLEQYPIVQRVFETQEIHSLRYDNAFSPHQIALLEAAELKSVLLVPLVRRQKVLGLLALGQANHPRSFTQSELRLTQNLAGQAAVAIEHAHLFSQAQRRVEELSTFHEIVLQLNTPLELGEVLDSITEAALKLVDAHNMHIFLYDAETQQFTYGSALWYDGSRKPAVASPRPNGITMKVVQEGVPIVINDASNHPLFQTNESKPWGICAIAGFPLKHEDQVIGVFTTTYLRTHAFSEEETLLLNLLADQAAVAVKNARLYDEAQRRLRDMSALVDMAKQVTSNLNLESVLQTTVQILRKLLNARASTIVMVSEDETELIVEATAGVSPEFSRSRLKLGEGVSGEVMRSGEHIYIRDTYREPDFLFFDEVVRSLLVMPLIIRDQTRGTLTVDSDKSNAFNKSDIQLMTIAAAQVSIAISNARLFAELEERAAELAVAYEELKENDRLKDELVQNVSHELRTPL